MPRTQPKTAHIKTHCFGPLFAEVFGTDQVPKGPAVGWRQPTPTVSKTVQRLLAQVQAEAQAATLEALSAKDGIVVLQPMEVETRSYSDSDYISCKDARGARISLWRDRNETPWHWHGTERLIDGRGREWARSLEAHVIDDFGSLVPVEGGAA